MVPADGQLKASRANGADGEAGGGRDTMRYGGRARQSGGDCRVTGEDPALMEDDDGWG